MYTVEKSEASEFEFKVGRKVYRVPRRESLPVPKFREIRARIQAADNQAEEAINAMFDLFDEFAPGALDSMTFDQAMKLVNAYSTEGDEETLGESSPSSD